MAGVKGGGVNKIAVVWSSVQFTVVSCGLGERVLLSFFFSWIVGPVSCCSPLK